MYEVFDVKQNKLLFSKNCIFDLTLGLAKSHIFNSSILQDKISFIFSAFGQQCQQPRKVGSNPTNMAFVGNKTVIHLNVVNVPKSLQPYVDDIIAE